ncbi:MAG TPA: PAS domain S-box protein [Gammaproteobacteria bacterium]
MNFRLPLTLSITLMILLLLAIQAAALMFYNIRDIEQKLKQDTQRELVASANFLQGFVEFLYSKNELNQVQDEISALSSNPHVKLAMLVDETNKVVAASRIEFRDEMISQVDLINNSEKLNDLIKQARKSRQLHLHETIDENDVLIMQPLILGTSASSIRPDKIGVLILQSNMRQLRNHYLGDMLVKQIPIWILMVVFTSLVVFVFYMVYIKRLMHISQVAQQVSRGNHKARVNLDGYDEIGFLGKFFNRMLDSINDQQQELFETLDALSQREQNLNLTLQSIGDAVIATDTNGLVIRMNPVASHLTGWQEQDALGKPLDEVFHIINAQARTIAENPVKKVLTSGKVVGLANHTVLISKQGNEYQIADSAAPIKDDDGNIFGVIMVFHDVTQQYDMQRAVYDSEQRLQLTLSAIEEGLWDWDIQTGNVYYSPAWENLLGYEQGEIAHNLSSWENLIHPDDKKNVMESIQAHFRGETPQYEAEHRLRKKNGEWIWVLGRGKVVQRDEKGNALRALGTASDISDIVAERKRQQQRVEQIKRNQQALLRWTQTEFIYLKDAFKMATELAAKTLDIERVSIWFLNESGDSITYEDLYTLSNGQHQSGIEIERSGNEVYFDTVHRSNILAVEDALHDAATECFIDSYIKRNNIRSILDVAILIQGKVIGVISHEAVGKQQHWSQEKIDFATAMASSVALAIEIRQRRYAEKALDDLEQVHKQILDHLVDGVISIDQKGTILSFNRGAEFMFGYDVNEVLGKNIKMLMPNDIARHHDGYIENYINTGIGRVIGIGREVTGKRKNGTTFPLRLSVSEIPGDESGVRRFVGNCSDISQERHREEMLRRTQKMDAIGKLTGGIAHDYNNMLGVILGYGDLLQNLFKHDPKAVKYIDAILNAAERGKNLTQSLLAFTRRRETGAESVDINEVIRQDEHMLAKTLTAKIQLHLDLDDPLWKVYVDKGELEDAILNIVINGMHAMPNGGHLTITTENESISEMQSKVLGLAPGNYIALAITDSGCGIEKENLDKIFDPFYTTKGDLGTGLGLSQVYGFMRRSNGCIDVASEVNVGTQMVMYFPQNVAAEDSQKISSYDQSQDLRGHETILVVDDEVSLRELSYEILSDKGYVVLLAETADEALELLHQQHVDLIISDVIMPGLNGFELAELVQKQYPDIKIQLVSGYNEQYHHSHNKQLANQLLHKPYQASHLLERVRQLLR